MSSAAHEFSWERFYQLPVVGILRGFEAEVVKELVGASLRGGLKNIEVTMNTPGAEGLIGLTKELAAGEMHVGAGTVCSPEDLERALAAGAQFIVTPVLVPEVVTTCRERGVPVFPGAFTPTEIYTAWKLGADVVKVFPARFAGPTYIKEVRAPLEQIKLMPTGGVTVETLAEFVHAGAVAFGVGSPLFAPAKVKARDWRWVEEQARRFTEAYRLAAAG